MTENKIPVSQAEDELIEELCPYPGDHPNTPGWTAKLTHDDGTTDQWAQYPETD